MSAKGRSFIKKMPNRSVSLFGIFWLKRLIIWTNRAFLLLAAGMEYQYHAFEVH